MTDINRTITEEVPENLEIPVAEVVETPAAPVELPEQRYEFQPTDEHNRPIGGKQVILYRTQDELIDKLKNQNVLVVRKLREESRKRRLGIDDDNDSIPKEAQTFEDIVEFKPRALSAEETYQISEDLKDSEKFASARDRLLESAIGVPPEKLTSVLNRNQLLVLQLTAKSNYESFESRTPEFYNCPDNKETLTDWMFKKKLAPTAANFTLAFSRLKEAGLLLETPIAREVVPPAPVTPAAVVTESNPQIPVVPETRIGQENDSPQKRQSRLPSSLNSSNTSSNGLPVEVPSMTLKDIDRMPSSHYREWIKNPANVKLLDKLEADRRSKSAQ